MKKARMMKLITIVTAFVMMLGLFVPISTMNVEATQSRKENFSTNYTLIGNGATDILNIAMAQIGKTGSQLGYTEQWCADFVSDCADLAGQSAAVPRTGAVNHEYTSSEKWYGLKQTILRAGGVDVGLANAQPGDIVFFSGHVEIVYSGTGSSIKSIGGNTGKGSTLYSRVVCSPRVHGSPVCVLRPNYSGNPILPEPLATPTISTDKSSYTVGDTVYLSWAASPANSNLSHYWLTVIAPDGTWVYGGTMNLETSYSFVASQAGDYAITTYATPKGSLEGEGSLTDTATITVNAPKPIEFYCSSTDFLVSTDWEDVKSQDIEFWYYNYTEGVTIGFEHGENQKTICEWGEWENDSITLTVTAIEGCENGTELLTVYLKNTETGERLAEKTLSVKMLNDAVYSSESAVTIHKTENETKQIIFTYDCVSASSLYIHADPDSYDNVSLDWGEWSNSQLPLTLEGISSGIDNIVFEMIDYNTGEVLATTTVQVEVIENKCTVKWNSNYEGGPINYTEYTVGDKFGSAANTININRPGFIFEGWYASGTKITADTIVPNQDELTLYARWKADGVYVSIDTVELTLDELIAADYKVTVPVRVSGSGGWRELGYGVSWDTDELLTISNISTGEPIKEASTKGIVMHVPAVNYETGLLWAGAIASVDESDYTTQIYVEDGIISYITFTINPSAVAGDMYIITALDTSPEGTRAIISTANGGDMNYNVSDGAIIIKENPVTTTTTITTTTATTTTTTIKTTGEEKNNSVTTTTTTKTTTTTTKTTTTTTTATTTNDAEMYGDVNADTVVNLVDAVTLNKYLAKAIDLTDTQLANADCCKDKVLNGADATALIRYLVRIITELPINPS